MLEIVVFDATTAIAAGEEDRQAEVVSNQCVAILPGTTRGVLLANGWVVGSFSRHAETNLVLGDRRRLVWPHRLPSDVVRPTDEETSPFGDRTRFVELAQNLHAIVERIVGVADMCLVPPDGDLVAVDSSGQTEASDAWMARVLGESVDVLEQLSVSDRASGILPIGPNGDLLWCPLPGRAAACVAPTSLHGVRTVDLDVLNRLLEAISMFAAGNVWPAVGSTEMADPLATLAAAVNRAWTVDAVAEAVGRHGTETLGAALISTALVEDGLLRFVHGIGVDGAVAEAWPTAPLSAPIPMAVAARDGRPVVLGSDEDFRAWPVFDEAVSSLSISSFVALPVRSRAGGTAAAVIGLGFAQPLASPEPSAHMQRLAELTEQGLDRAVGYQRARRHAQLLETIALPTQLPVVPDLEVGGRYLPPTVHQRVGGDLYDVISLDDRRVSFVIADASGHDLEASKAIARIRHAIGVLAFEETSPAQVLRAVDWYLKRSGKRTLVTCVCGFVDIESGELIMANAGHPQPRLIRRDGSVSAIGPLGDPLLGYGPSHYREDVVHLGVGDTFVAFTDGLIERRSESFVVSEARLDEQLATVRFRNAEDLALRLTERLPVERDDDVAVLAIRRPAESRSMDVLWSAPAGTADLADVRETVRRWLDPAEVRLDDVLLVVTELVTNARTACDEDGIVVLRGQVVTGPERSVVIEVENPGEPFSHVPDMPEPSEVRGRGLAMTALLSDLSVFSTGSGTVVRASFGDR